MGTLIIIGIVAVILYLAYRLITNNSSQLQDSDGDMVADDLDIYDDGAAYRAPVTPTVNSSVGSGTTSGSSPGSTRTETRRNDSSPDGLFIPMVVLNDTPETQAALENETSNSDLSELESIRETETINEPTSPFGGGEPTEFAGAGAGGGWEPSTDNQNQSDDILDLPPAQNETPSYVTDEYVQAESAGQSETYTPSVVESTPSYEPSPSSSYDSGSSSSSSSSSSSDSGSSYSSSSDSSSSSSDSGSSSSDSGSSSSGDSGW